jgi:hypothetical protein
MRILLALLPIFSLLTVPSLAQPREMALLAGVSNYPETSGWRPLGAANDLDLLQEALERKGFRVSRLEEEQATHQGILDALAKVEKDLRPGDMFLFHFSGHGQQLADDNGDEFDRLDEGLVPFDAPARYEAGVYEGERHLRDDELGAALLRLRNKLGSRGQLLVTIDACHSGTAVRGTISGIYRGTAIPLAPAGYITGNENAKGENNLPEALPSEAGEGNLAPMIVFSASAANQMNKEFPAPDGKSYGPLSYAFCQAIGGGALTYQSLFEQIRVKMAFMSPRQTPQAEGSLDAGLFLETRAASESTRHYTVDSVWDATTIYIDGGLLAGVHQGAILAFYPPGARDLEKVQPLAKGTVSESWALRAEVSLDSPVKRAEILSSWAMMEVQTFGDIFVKVRIDMQEAPELETALKNVFQAYPFIIHSENDFDLLVRRNEDGAAFVQDNDGQFLDTVEFLSPETMADMLTEEIILPYVQARFLRQMNFSGAAFEVEVKLHPVDETGKERFPEASGQYVYEFALGEQFYFEISNLGSEPCYFSILDIQPDNSITALVPEPSADRLPEDYYLQPGETRRVPRDMLWEASEPVGVDCLKIIATDRPANLASILRYRGKTPKKPSIFESLLSQTFLKRGIGKNHLLPISGIPAGNAQVSTLMIRVREN